MTDPIEQIEAHRERMAAIDPAMADRIDRAFAWVRQNYPQMDVREQWRRARLRACFEKGTRTRKAQVLGIDIRSLHPIARGRRCGLKVAARICDMFPMVLSISDVATVTPPRGVRLFPEELATAA